MEAWDILKELGWTEYQTRAYLALTSLGEASASQIARRADIPRNKSYEALSFLAQHGFVLEISSRPMLFKTTGTKPIMDSIQSEQERLTHISKHIEESFARKDAIPPTQDLVWVIKGQREIMQRISKEMHSIQKEALACTRASRDDPQIFRDARASLARGVRVCILGSLTEDNVALVREWINLGAEYRVYDSELFGPHGLRFSIFDEKSCRITIGKPEIPLPQEYLTIWSESRSLVESFRRQFFWMWDKCSPAQDSNLFKSIDS